MSPAAAAAATSSSTATVPGSIAVSVVVVASDQGELLWLVTIGQRVACLLAARTMRERECDRSILLKLLKNRVAQRVRACLAPGSTGVRACGEEHQLFYTGLAQKVQPNKQSFHPPK